MRPKVKSWPCIVCRGLCLTSKLPPPPLPPPHFLSPGLPLQPDSTNRGEKRKKKKTQRERDSGRDGESASPQLSSSSRLYACLIGQKQHACLCSQANGWTLDWAGGPGSPPRPQSFRKHRLPPLLLLLGCLRDGCCRCLASDCSLRIAGGGCLAAAVADWPRLHCRTGVETWLRTPFKMAVVTPSKISPAARARAASGMRATIFIANILCGQGSN